MKFLAFFIIITSAAFADFKTRSFATQKVYAVSKEFDLTESTLTFLYAPDASEKQGYGYYVIMLPDNRSVIMNTTKWNEFYNAIIAYYSLKAKHITNNGTKGEFRIVAGNILVELDGKWVNLEVSFTNRIKGVNARALELSIESSGKYYLTNLNDDAILGVFRQDKIGQVDYELRAYDSTQNGKH